MTLPRILYAVPRLPHVQWEIAKAIHALADVRVQCAEPGTEFNKTQTDREAMAEIARDAFIILGKVGYDPSEPRVPAGHPDGGEWTSASGGTPSNTSGTVLSDAASDNNWIPGAQYAANDPPGIGHNQGPPLEDPPDIPPRVLATRQAINNFLKAAAYWLEDASAVNKTAATLFFVALMATGWLADKYLPYIVTYQDPPRTLQELQQAAQLPKIEYYNDHHLVEQTAAENDGFPRSIIDGPDNLVRIPTLKHWLITGWYQIPNSDYDGLSPRQYLQGKTWEERVRVGKDALIEFGVLKP